MKKIYKALFLLTVGAFTFTACEDVPAPYPIPGTEQGSDDSGQGGGGSTGLNVIFSEEFDGGQGKFVFDVVSNPSNLSYVWKSETYNTSTYLKASAYASSKSNEAEAWAVSPAINLKDSKKATLKFRHAINKIAPGVPSEMMTVWASTDYAGDVKTAKWTKLVVPTYPAGDSWTFVDAGSIDLGAFCGQAKVYIGFKYTSTNDYSGTWEVDAFEVLGDGTPMTDEPVAPPTTDGEGTLEKPYSVSEALALVTSGNIPAEEVYIQGVVSYIKEISTEYGNATYDISADGTANGDQLTVYRGKYLNGDKFTSEDQLKVGNKVIVLGVLTKYYDSPQVNTNSKLYSIDGVGGNEGGNTGGNEGGNTGGNEGEEGGGETNEDIYEGVPGEWGNYLLNGGFEEWSGNQPIHWETACTAGNASMSKSTIARSGNSSVLVKGSSKNTRIAFREMTLPAGTYIFSFYVRAAGDVEGSCRPGVAFPPAEGSLTGNDYVYGDYVNNLSTDEWTEVSHTITLEETKTVCVLVMNPKSPGKDFLIDDARLICMR
ncbi:MAG: choice-of-anchor J domain-containing protein [Paraprevotella sp.]|nr:choice-of-anchor J domain-containing protein [Paraprevotella sp.]